MPSPLLERLCPEASIYHYHCKNAVKNVLGKIEWPRVDKGFINWTIQFRAVKQLGDHNSMRLETY